MVKELLSSLSLNDLLGKLHSSILDLMSSLDKVIEVDESLGSGEISELRNHITDRINKGDEELENKKLLSVLNLLIMNESAIRVMRNEADEWLEFVDVIERKLAERGALTSGDKEEIDNIGSAIDDIRSALRGS